MISGVNPKQMELLRNMRDFVDNKIITETEKTR